MRRRGASVYRRATAADEVLSRRRERRQLAGSGCVVAYPAERPAGEKGNEHLGGRAHDAAAAHVTGHDASFFVGERGMQMRAVDGERAGERHDFERAREVARLAAACEAKPRM